MVNQTDPRLSATRHLFAVIEHKRTLDQALTTDTQPLVRELVSGTLRYYFSLTARVEAHLRKPLRSKDLDVHLLLLIGAYQLIHTRIPKHAAVSETVACAKKLKKPWARGLVNAVLRAISVETDLAATISDPATPAELDHPAWFIEHIRRALPNHWQAILQANNTRAPMSIRINQRKISPATYREKLRDEKITAELRYSAQAETLTLDSPISQRTLPGYEEGEVAVQDASAQLACSLINKPSGPTRVLDACAAPGGKAFHLLETFPEIDMLLLDNAAKRVENLRREASRLGHDEICRIEHADATDLEWWDQQPFDLILIDAPCSGSGTVRRHPDIKLLREPADLIELVERQLCLLMNLWQTLIPGGTLLYSTCSLFHEENDAVINRFIDAHRDAKIVTLRMPEGVSMTHGWQTLPSAGGGDGFYYAKLTKHNAEPSE